MKELLNLVVGLVVIALGLLLIWFAGCYLPPLGMNHETPLVRGLVFTMFALIGAFPIFFVLLFAEKIGGWCLGLLKQWRTK